VVCVEISYVKFMYWVPGLPPTQVFSAIMIGTVLTVVSFGAVLIEKRFLFWIAGILAWLSPLLLLWDYLEGFPLEITRVMVFLAPWLWYSGCFFRAFINLELVSHFFYYSIPVMAYFGLWLGLCWSQFTDGPGRVIGAAFLSAISPLFLIIILAIVSRFFSPSKLREIADEAVSLTFLDGLWNFVFVLFGVAVILESNFYFFIVTEQLVMCIALTAPEIRVMILRQKEKALQLHSPHERDSQLRAAQTVLTTVEL
jgi:hypothetical protein